jgi:hypothetical protein
VGQSGSISSMEQHRRIRCEDGDSTLLRNVKTSNLINCVCNKEELTKHWKELTFVSI